MKIGVQWSVSGLWGHTSPLGYDYDLAEDEWVSILGRHLREGLPQDRVRIVEGEYDIVWVDGHRDYEVGARIDRMINAARSEWLDGVWVYELD